MHKRYMDLEKRCKKYYMKKYTKYTFAIVVVLLGVALVFMSFVNTDDQGIEVTQKDLVVQASKEEKKLIEDSELEEMPIEIAQDRSVEELQAKEESVEEIEPQEIVINEVTDEQELEQNDIAINQTPHRLEPIYSFEIDELLQSSSMKELTLSKIDEEKEEEAKDTPPQTAKEETVVTQDTPPLVQRGLIQAQDIELIEHKIAIFNQRPHYDRAYGIAYDYFVKQEYEEAIKWLLKADSLNSAQEKVFELYAKSLYKLGRNTQAINLLDYYLQLKQSNRLEVLKRLIQEESDLI